MSPLEFDMMYSISRNLPEIARQLKLKNKIELLKLRTNLELSSEDLKEIA